MEDLVILFSGGADSRLMLEQAIKFYKRKPYCVLIDYEQLHLEELTSAAEQLVKLDVPYQVVKLHDLNINSGLTGDGNKLDRDDTHEMHVPSRNLMFVGIAASIAESKDIKEVWYGADYSDVVNQFPDCMPEWIRAMQKILQINGPDPIIFDAPLINWSKVKIIEELKEVYGISQDEIFSGYGEVE